MESDSSLALGNIHEKDPGGLKMIRGFLAETMNALFVSEVKVEFSDDPTSQCSKLKLHFQVL